MKTVIVKWLEPVNGSQYTLHETDRIGEPDVTLAVDALGDPTNFKYKFVPKAKVPKFADFEEGYYDPWEDKEKNKLENLYDSLAYKEHYVGMNF